MASAQVLPSSSRKEGHLQAGKRRLEEFRRKNAAKQAAAKSQPQVAEASSHEQKHLETERVRYTDSDDAVSSSGANIKEEDNKNVVYDDNSGKSSSNYSHVSPPSTTKNEDRESNKYGSLSFDDLSNANYNKQANTKNGNIGIPSRAHDEFPYRNMPDRHIDSRASVMQEIGSNSSLSSYSGLDEAWLRNSSPSKTFDVDNSGNSDVNSSENPDRALSQNKSDSAIILPNGHVPSLFEGIRQTRKLQESGSEVGHNSNQFKDQGISDLGGSKYSGLVDNLYNRQSGPSYESLSTNFSFDVKSSSDPDPPYTVTSEIKTRSSRPSFLDSLNISRESPASPFSSIEPKNDGLFASNNSKAYSMGTPDTLVSGKPFMETKMEEPFSKMRSPSLPGVFEHSIGSSSFEPDRLRQSAAENNFEGHHMYQSRKHDEDFAALEQHIEDVTQEKFSLQRAIEASRVLAESLATENSSLTESYNQQGSFVNQLQCDMEKLQNEINGQLAELESLKMEYGNVLLECNAADERGKLLASEVIGLEEKVLRLRSSELKLERQLENSYAEMASYKKKISSLEKERQDLLSTIDALQEEKKLMQSKLRKASVSGIDVSKITTEKKDTSTSTDDLDVNSESDPPNLGAHDSASVVQSDTYRSSSTLLYQELNVNVSSIPSDQMRMIQNIDIIISELTLEKEELINALEAETSNSAKLKDLNKDLSKKLETQTQRLELLTAQSMANGNVLRKQLESPPSHDISAFVDESVTTYADEGDEVVERVLGWIMKLFPGGPSKRRTSKLL